MANDRIRHKNLGGTFSKKTLKKFSNHADGTKSIWKLLRLMVLWKHSDSMITKKLSLFFYLLNNKTAQ